LDIPQKQFLRYVPGGGSQAADALFWHHSIGMRHLRKTHGPSHWIIRTPDEETMLFDLGSTQILPLKRNALFPAARAAAEDIYAFDATDWDDDDRKAAEADADALCELLGVEDDEDKSEMIWIYSEADSPFLGKEISDATLAGLGAEKLYRIGDKGVAEIDGLVVHIRRVPIVELMEIVTQIRPPVKVATDDVRIAFAIDPDLYHVSEDVGKLIRGLTAHPKNAHWGFTAERDGPAAIVDYVPGAIEAAQTLINFPIVWRKDCGIEDTSRIRHEQDHIHEVLQTALVRDGLNIYNCLCFEKMIRRVQYTQRERTVERGSSARARIFLGGVRDQHGGVRTPAFDEWAFQREKTDAKARSIAVQDTANQLEAARQERDAKGKRKKGDGKGDTGKKADDGDG